MPYEETVRAAPHALALDERARLNVTGVQEIERFDEQLVVVRTVKGELSVHGEGMKVDMLDKSGGTLHVTGRIDELVYSRPHEEKGGFWARLWS